MRRPIIFCVATWLLLTATTLAQYRGGYSYPSYSYPVYVDRPVYYKETEYVPVAAPVPFTVAVPVVSYLYNGSTFSPAYLGQPAYQSAGIAAYPPTATGGLTSALSQLSGASQLTAQQQGAASATAVYGAELSDAVIDRIILRIEQRLAQRQAALQQGPPPPVRQSPYAALTILSNRCARCHTGATAQRGVVIFSSPGVPNPNVNRAAVVEAVEDGRMPLGDDRRPRPLPHEEVEALRQWRGGR
jgi:hypothetical protein